MKAIAKHLRISSKKANLVAGLVRKKNAVEALDILKFTPKKGAQLLYKVLHSAMANAEKNFKQDKNALIVQEIVVTEGRTLKRSVPVSRGRVHPRKKRTAHITVTVGLNEPQASSKEGAKATEAKVKKVEAESKVKVEKKEKAEKEVNKSTK